MLAAIVNGEVDEATLVDLAKVASALNDSMEKQDWRSNALIAPSR